VEGVLKVKWHCLGRRGKGKVTDLLMEGGTGVSVQGREKASVKGGLKKTRGSSPWEGWSMVREVKDLHYRAGNECMGNEKKVV